MLPTTLRLNRVVAPVFNLGPGRRIGIWVQGCSLGCSGCLSPTLWKPEGGRELTVEMTLALLDRIEPAATGLTLTGGEPFEQYEAMLALASAFKSSRRGDVLVYSGYTLEELRQRHTDRTFENIIDYLIDGRFDEKKPSDDGVRGSTNQRVWRFSAGRAELFLMASEVERVAVVMARDSVVLTGVPASGQLDELEARVGASGVPLRFGR